MHGQQNIKIKSDTELSDKIISLQYENNYDCYSFIMIRSTWWFWDSLYNAYLVRAGRSGDGIPVWGNIFHTRPDRPRGPHSLLFNGYRVFPGGKTAGACRWSPTPSSAEVKERVELYLYFRPEPSWAVVLGWIYIYCTFLGKLSSLCLSNISRYRCNVHGCYILLQQKIPKQCVFGFAWSPAPEQCKWVVRTSGMFRGVNWSLPTFRDSESVPRSRSSSPRPVY